MISRRKYSQIGGSRVKAAGVSLGVLTLAACAQTPPPPPIPVAPPVYIQAPPRPYLPAGATRFMAIPPKTAGGLRQTVNTSISTAQVTWNMRAALNVAALNCLQPEHQAILANYQTFLTKFERPLASANRTMSREFSARYGREGRAVEDAYLTKLYNYFAMPQVQDEFCDAALALSNEAIAVEVAELDSFTAQSLPRMEQVFERFFSAYDQYRENLVRWELTYGPYAALDPYALQRAIAATPLPAPQPQPLPTSGPILR